MASTAKSAVSDYEHLKYRFWDDNNGQTNESEDEDFLPLKAKVKLQSNQPAVLASINSNQNNPFYHSNSEPNLDENSIDLIQNIPTPSLWSPGMIVKPNPSLFVTPEKPTRVSSVSLYSDKDNILEPRDLNTVPAPVAWSPHSNIKPSVLVTPEKPGEYIGGTVTHTSGLQSNTVKSREKLTVRFDLPSSSSGDEFMDSSSLSDSLAAITIKGKDLESEGEHCAHSSPSKAYNPIVYSDDSVLDDSFPEMGKSIRESDTVGLSTSSNLVNKLNQLLLTSDSIGDKSSTCLSQSTNHSSSKDLFGSKQGTVSSKKMYNRNVTNDKNNKPSNSKLTTRSKTAKTTSHRTNGTRSGPHHLSSSTSPYYPPNSGACVVRESKHHMVSTDYSYPFKNAEGTEEYEHIFCRPEFNSTLKVRSELDNLCDQAVDMDKAMKVKLSSAKKTEIQEKAAFYTNHASDQFTNLVDVEPSIERLCDHVVRMRTSKSTTQKKGNKNKPDKQKNSMQKEPDLMEFFSSDLQRESPDFSLPGISLVTPGLVAAPHDHAFDCYRHNRVWSQSQNF